MAKNLLRSWYLWVIRLSIDWPVLKDDVVDWLTSTSSCRVTASIRDPRDVTLQEVLTPTEGHVSVFCWSSWKHGVVDLRNTSQEVRSAVLTFVFTVTSFPFPFLIPFLICFALAAIKLRLTSWSSLPDDSVNISSTYFTADDRPATNTWQEQHSDTRGSRLELGRLAAW